MPKVKLAAGFFIFHGAGKSRRWLLLKNSIHKTWGFPKGLLEKGEDVLSGAMRELREETGIREARVIREFERSIKYDAKNASGAAHGKRVTYFLAETPSAQVSLSSEHDEFRWTTDAEAKNLIAFDNLRKAFSDAREFLKRRRAPQD
jgi:8-oxo-dGTP pyrophosphatase MutT (NUDIX family)